MRSSRLPGHTAMDPLKKQFVFVGTCILGGFLAFGAAAGIGADYWEPLVGLALAVVLVLAIVGLFAIAARLFPDKGDDHD